MSSADRFSFVPLSMFTSVNRSLTIRFSRSISLFTSPRNSLVMAGSGGSWYSRVSIMIFIVLSGVFSSCEALDTNWLLDLSSCSRRSDIELKARARLANSLLPLATTRADRSPWLMREIPSFNSPMGRVIMRSSSALTTTTARATMAIQASILSCISRRLS